MLLAEDGTPRLTDFGLAHVADSPQLTEADVLMGTVDYLSPEACRGEELDTRTDIWSFGVMLYEMLYGELPFTGNTATAKLLAILTQPVPDLYQGHSEMSDGLADLVYRMLEKDRYQRIPSVRLVGAELEALLQGRDTPSSTPRSVGASVQASRFATPTTPHTAERRHNLPAQPTPFVGREEELIELERLLADPGVRLLTIFGPGGMGKTRLALEAGAAQTDNFAHGIYFVALAPLQSVDGIVPAMADAVGFSFSTQALGGTPVEPHQQLLNYLQQKQMLLIADNFEHLLDGVSVATDILQTAPGIKVLATSRARLNTQGEQLFHITGMGFPNWETPEDALEYSAVKLFMQSARRVRPGFELQADDLQYISRICRLVAGMPLAILLAAAWIEMLSPEEIATEIGRSLDFLETDQRDVPERQRSVRAVFDYSWNLLTEREQEVCRALSVFHGGFTRQAAQEITGASLRELMRLVDKSLLHRTPTGRYETHELLRQYAAEELDRFPQVSEAIHDRHCAYYIDALQQWEKDLKSHRQQIAKAEMHAEIENARAAWDWAVEHDQAARLDRAMNGLCHFYFQRGRFVEIKIASQKAAERLSKATSSYELRMLAKAQIWQAIATGWLGDGSVAYQLLQQGLSLLQDPRLAAEDTRWEQAFALRQRGYVSRFQDRERTWQMLEQSLTLSQSLDDRWLTATILGTMGTIAHESGVYEKAKETFEKSLAIQRAIGDQAELAGSLVELGLTSWVQGHLEKSERLLKEGIALIRQTDNQNRLAYGLQKLGEALMLLGKLDEAQSAASEGLTVAQDLGAYYEISINYLAIAEVEAHMGQYERAIAHAQTGLNMNQEGGFLWGIAFAQFAVGLGTLGMGAYIKAQQALDASSTGFREIHHRENLAWALALSAYADRGLGQSARARQHLAEALRITVDLGVFVPLTYGLPAAALILADAGQNEHAVEVYALASRYPFVANSKWFEDVAGKSIAQAAAALPVSVAAAAQARGGESDPEATIAELLTELTE